MTQYDKRVRMEKKWEHKNRKENTETTNM